jgi:hypothetical protein
MTKMTLVQHHLGQIRHLLETIPPSRERSMVATKLDEAEMWAKANPNLLALMPESVNEVGPVGMDTDIQQYGYEGDG